MTRKKNKNKKKSAVGNFYETYDGFFNNKAKIDKNRTVIAVHQRKTDGAVAVVKVFSKDGKEDKTSDPYIPDLVLKPQKYSDLDKESYVGRQIYFGVKVIKKYKPLYAYNFKKKSSKLDKKDLKKVIAGIQNREHRHRRTYETTRKRWKNHFKK